MLNSINLIGRLTKDPELRKTNSDVSFATFTIAVDNNIKEADGTRGTCFLDCRIFREAAENLVKYVRKGHKVGISGSINQRNFVRQDGTKGHDYVVLVDNVEYLEAKPVQEDEDIDPSLLEAIEEEAKGSVKTQAQIEDEEAKPQAKYDPYTGKPLKPAKK